MSPGTAPNPFTNRAMITDARDFFGRGRELEALLARVLGGSKAQSCSVVGQRRIGKSSLFRRVLDLAVARDPRVAAVYEDLEASRKLTSERFFATLLRRLSRAVGTESRRVEDADAFEALTDFLEAQEGRRRFLLFLDEFDAVTANPAFDADFFGALRSITNRFDLGFVTSSYRDLGELCHTEEVRQSPFFNVFTTLDLGLVSPADAALLVDTLGARAGAPLDEDTRAAVLALGGRYPFFLQVAGSAAWELRAAGSPLDEKVLEEQFRAEADGHFRYFVEHLDADERAALAPLIGGESVSAALLRRLVRRGLVTLDAGSPSLALPFSPAFAAYLREAASAALAGSTLAAPRRGQETQVAETTPSPVPADVEVGKLVGGRYTLERTLGSGAFGAVFAARDSVLGRPVALKLLRIDLPGRDSDLAERRVRFRREAQALARMRHPNVVTVHDYGEWEGRPFIAMELVLGRSLADLLRERGTLTFAEARSAVLDAARGLAHAHAMGVVHRDVKPANLMVEPDGRVRVADFGMMREVGVPGASGMAGPAAEVSVLTAAGHSVGTPAYMAPEQVRGEAVDARADVWALGVVLYECLAGRRPFEGDSLPLVLAKILVESPPEPGAAAHAAPAGLGALLRRALEKDRAARFESAEELALALAALGEAAGPWKASP